MVSSCFWTTLSICFQPQFKAIYHLYGLLQVKTLQLTVNPQIANYFATNGFELRPLVLGPEDPNFRKDNRDLILKRKQQHDMWVQKTCPKEKLLTYRIGEGWEPICKFLNKPGIVLESTYDISYPLTISAKNFTEKNMRKICKKILKR